MRPQQVNIHLYEKGDTVILPLDLQSQCGSEEGEVVETEWLFNNYDELSSNPNFDVFNVRRNVIISIPTENPFIGPLSVSGWSLRPKMHTISYKL